MGLIKKKKIKDYDTYIIKSKFFGIPKLYHVINALLIKILEVKVKSTVVTLKIIKKEMFIKL